MTAQDCCEFRFGMTFQRAFTLVCDGLVALILAAAGGIAYGRAFSFGLLFFLAALIWMVALYLSVFSAGKLYVRVSPEEISVFPGGLSTPRFCRWQDVTSFQEIPGKKLIIEPTDDRTITISLGLLLPEDRKNLVELVHQNLPQSTSQQA